MVILLHSSTSSGSSVSNSSTSLTSSTSSFSLMVKVNKRAEYRTLANSTMKLIWIQSLLKELDIFIPCSRFYGMIILAQHTSSQTYFSCSHENIKIDFHFARDKVASKSLEVCLIYFHRRSVSRYFYKTVAGHSIWITSFQTQRACFTVKFEGGCDN